MSYEIRYTDCREAVETETYQEAIDAITVEWPDAICEHDGDLTEGGDRTLCWPDAEAAGPIGTGDDGALAVASIYANQAD